MEPEMWVAMITALGGIAVAVLGNWDKLFRRDRVLTATFSGYRPTEDFETEYRHYFDVSGSRKTIDVMLREGLRQGRETALLEAEEPGDASEIKNFFDAMERETEHLLDDFIRAFMPVYQTHFTLAELQELNRFYSTEAMQNMVRKMPEVVQELAPIQAKMTEEFQAKVQENFLARIDDTSC